MLVTKDFVLVHVPKTGGTFLNALVRQHCNVLFDDMHRPYPQVPYEYETKPALAFVRNPFEWYVSWFEHMKQKGPESKDEWEWSAFRMETCDFPEFLERAFSLPHGFDYYSALVRNFTPGCKIGRTEHLREWFVRFLVQHGIHRPELAEAVLNAPKMNVGSHRPAASYYTAETAQLVWESWVCQEFGYASGAPIPDRKLLTDDDIRRRVRVLKEVEAAST